MNKQEYISQRLAEVDDEQSILVGHLVVEAGGNETIAVKYPIYNGITLVGCSEGAKVMLKSAGVSSMHALIQSDLGSGLTFVEDLDSTNGTSLNGGLNLVPRRLYQLLDGQLIRFGPSTCSFKIKQNSSKDIPHDEKNQSMAIGTPKLGDFQRNIVTCPSPVGKEFIHKGEISTSIRSSQKAVETNLGCGSKTYLTYSQESDGNPDLADSMILDDEESQNIAFSGKDSHTMLEKCHPEKESNFTNTADIGTGKNADNQNFTSDFSKTIAVTARVPKTNPVEISRRNTSKLEDFQISDEEDLNHSITAKEVAGNGKISKPKKTVGKSVKAPQKRQTSKKNNFDIKKISEELLKGSMDAEIENADNISHPEKLTEQFEKSPENAIGKDVPEERISASNQIKGVERIKPSKKALSVSKSVLNELDFVSSTRKRKRSGFSVVRILFAGGCENAANIKTVKQLGGEVVKEWSQCTHMVTDKLKRTIKFLCCLSSGRQILSPKWINDSLMENKWLDPDEYLIKDPEAEKKFVFNLRESLQKTTNPSTPKLLHGLKFYSTISVQPPTEELRSIIESAGGKLLIIPPKTPATKNPKLFIIGHESDWKECESLGKMGYKIYKKDLILTGILRQKLEFKGNLLQ